MHNWTERLYAYLMAPRRSKPTPAGLQWLTFAFAVMMVVMIMFGKR